MHYQPLLFTTHKQKLRTHGIDPAAANLWITTLALLLSTVAVQGQVQRCDLVGRDTTVVGNPVSFKRCLDLATLDGKTLTVPSNVTRIDNDGLSLCNSTVQTGGNVDIVYVYDNSGSMDAIGRAGGRIPYAYIQGTDTTFYYGSSGTGCDTTTIGTVTFNVYNTNGVGTVPYTIARLKSNAGCSDFSGDPYNVRGAAFRQGLEHQASRAPQSTAGIMSFTSSVGNFQRPLVLTPANLNTLENKIYAYSNGGTNYTAPLDTSKNWLIGTPAITSNPKKAIIFLSDGRHNDSSDYLKVLSTNYRVPGTMPPIYGIFLGKPRSDTAQLADLAQRTGGKFYLIPPNKPDSLIDVVENILNIILLNYQPSLATVTNTSIVPSQTASSGSADFIPQSDGSWLMKLNDLIGLRPLDLNTITINTTFKEKTSGVVDTKSISFTIKTTDPASTTSQKITNTQVAIRCYDPSTLRILNSSGIRPPFFTNANTAYQVRVRTSATVLDSVFTPSLTKTKGDAESPLIKSPVRTADSLVFQNSFAFKVETILPKTNGNGTLESALYDSIIVSWAHPRDPQDRVSDTLPVRASKNQAVAYFSATEGGPPITSYTATTTAVYVVILDQVKNPRMTYTAAISSDYLIVDREIVNLKELPDGSGTFVAKITISLDNKNPGDNLLQVSNLGDQLRVVYQDPVDGDSAVGTAGFAQTVEEAGNLQFTNAAGAPLPADTVWSPANGKLYISYSDDYLNGTRPLENISLTLASKKYGGVLGNDDEKVVLSLLPGSTGTRATWTGSIDLVDAFPAIDSNGKAETRFRGEASISVNSHLNTGSMETATLTDFLVIAYPDSSAGLQWKLADPVGLPTGSEGLIVTVTDQNFTNDPNDLVFVTVTCTKSGDSVSSFQAREGLALTYSTGTLVKDEGAPSATDRNLSCLTTDQIRITYVDPVYGTRAELILDEVAKPEATPVGRNFITNELVTLSSSTPGSVIYYTLDGTLPKPGVSNVYTDPLRISLTTTVTAVAVKPGWKDSKVMTQTYTKTVVASRLEILDENGNQISGGFITGASKNLRIKLITTQDNLAGVKVDTRTLLQKDLELVFLNNSTFLGSAYEYFDNVPLNHPSPISSGNDTLNSIGTDTLIVHWVNPFNPLDFASDTLFIKPAFVAAEVYFSLTEGGARITTYPVNQDSLFIVVKTSPRDPALDYTVLVSSSEFGIDRLTLNLLELTPGVFSAKAPVSTGSKNQVDQIIQVAAAGDQLTAIFVDPIYKESYRGDVGFAQQVEESASLEFIDASGNLLAATDIWNPAKGKVYLRYTDDWNAGIDTLVKIKTVSLTLINKKTGLEVGRDSENLSLTLKGVPTGSRGTWEGEMTLVDRSLAKNGNDSLETYYRGELNASIKPHNNAGNPAGANVEDNLVIAYPNQSAEIVIQDTLGKNVIRITDKVQITIRDQLFTLSGEATLEAQVGCAQSQDVVSKATLVWDGSKYVIKPALSKGEVTTDVVVKSDALLLCRESDILIVTYVDPVYLDQRTAQVRWDDESKSRMYFASSQDSSEIKSVYDGVDKNFLLIVEGKSPKRDQVDTLYVILRTAQGEKLSVAVIETGVMTGKFVAKVDFLFSSANPDSTNKRVDAKIILANRINQVLLTGTVAVGIGQEKADLTLFSSYNLISKAYIKDEDENGRADHVYLVFDHKLSRLPNSLDSVYWNKVAPEFSLKAAAIQMSLPAGFDSTVVAINFTASQFAEGLTHIPAGQAPYALLPDDILFAGQRAKLADSIGPVVMTANKLPSNLQNYNYSGTEKRFNPDTLILTLSEQIKTNGASFNDLVRFSKGCGDYASSVPLKTFDNPAVASDGITWTVIVDNTPDSQTPLVGDCIFLNVGSSYIDLAGNIPGRLGRPLTGENPKLVIRGFRGFPPVAGLDAETPGFVLVTNDQRGGQTGTWSNQVGTGNWEVLWIPPYGFDAKDPVGSLQSISNNFTNGQAQDRNAENTTPKAMPPNISAVQVITSGAYKAQIHIYDNLGHFVRYMEQAYGMNGEDKNPWRATDKGQVSFLVWDLKDKDGQMAGQGVYVWKVSFMFIDKNKKSEVRFTRTGVMRN